MSKGGTEVLLGEKRGRVESPHTEHNSLMTNYKGLETNQVLNGKALRGDDMWGGFGNGRWRGAVVRNGE